MGWQNKQDKQNEAMKILNVENDSQTKVQISNDFNVYRAKRLGMLSECQHKWEGHLIRIRAPRPRIDLTSGDERPIHIEPNRAGHCPPEFERTKPTRCWQWLISNRPKHIGRHHRFCNQERWNTLILLGIPPSDRNYHLEVLSLTAHGWMHRVTWWCHDFLDTRG